MERGVSVVVSSYNQPRALAFVLEGLLRQSRLPDELIVADDGSESDTEKLVASFGAVAPFRTEFVTQQDAGFRKSKALNNGVRATTGTYVLFLDGDCIPTSHWVEDYVRALNRRARFAVAGYVRLSFAQAAELTRDFVRDGSFESLVTPEDRSRFWRSHLRQLRSQPLRWTWRPRILGGNWAAEKAALEYVNGFDEAYEDFSKEDSDIRNRLVHARMPWKSLWNSNWVFHCHHGIDPRRNLPDVFRKEPDRDYYASRKRTVRCPRGLVDETSLAR